MTLALLVPLALSSAAVAQAQQCSELSSLDFHAEAISTDGTTTVGWRGDFGAVLDGAGLTLIGPGGGTRTQAYDVSADGSVVVGGQVGTSTPTQAFRWTSAGGAQFLGSLGGSSVAFACSSDGSVVVGYSDTPLGEIHPFMWTASQGMQDLGFRGAARDVSSDGSVVVGFVRSGQPGATRAFRWSQGSGLQDLGPGTATAVSADGSVVVGSTSTAPDGGTAFRWTATTGTQPLDLLPSLPSAWCSDVSADGKTAVGACYDGTDPLAGLFPSRAYSVRWTVNDGVQVFGAPVGTHTQHFFGKVDGAWGVSGDGTVIVGGSQFGLPCYRVQVSDLGTSYCRPASANSAGCGGLILAEGRSLASVAALELTATLLPTNSVGYFLASRSQAFVANPGGSQGNLCLGGDIGRFVGAGQIQNSGQSGEFSLAVDLTALPTPSGLVQLVPGDTWNFQAWYRDSNPGPTNSFTDAVSIRFRP